MADPDWADPCSRAAALSAAYYGRLSGTVEERIRFRNGDDEEEVWFATSDLGALEREMKAAQAACDAKISGRPRRYAITGG